MEKLLKVSQQTFWQIAGKGVTSFTTLIILSMISRTYGPEGTGVYTLALTYLAFFFLAVDLGINAYLLPSLSSQPLSPNRIFTARLYWSLLLVVIANILPFFLPFSTPLFQWAVLYGSFSIICVGIFNSANLIFQSKLKYERSIIASSLGALALLPILGLIVYWQLALPTLLIATSVGWVLTALLALFFVSPLYQFSLRKIEFSFVKQVIKEAWPLSVTLLLNVIYFRVDAFILGSLYSFYEVGVYNLAYQLFQSALVLPTFITNSFYPMMIGLLQDYGKAKFGQQIQKVFWLMVGLGFLGTIVTFLIGGWIISIMAGPSFSASHTPLSLLSLSFPAFFGSSILMWVLVTLKRYKAMVTIYVIGLLLNIILNTILIPQYSYNGAAVVTVICEYLILILQLFILIKEFRK